MIILVLNSGSSSIKFQVRQTDGEKVLCKGLIESIGEPHSAMHLTVNGQKISRKQEMANHVVALNQMVHLLTSPELNILKSLADIKAVGHRVVHGGEAYSDSVLVDDKAIKTMRETGADMSVKYKETARGGLALNVVELPLNVVEC